MPGGVTLCRAFIILKGIRIASQDWLIIPKDVPVEEGLRVLVFDIYKTHDPIQGSIISIENTDDVANYINDIGRYFLHFGKYLFPKQKIKKPQGPRDEPRALTFPSDSHLLSVTDSQIDLSYAHTNNQYQLNIHRIQNIMRLRHGHGQKSWGRGSNDEGDRPW